MELMDRKFEPAPDPRARPLFALGLAGSALLGAGAFGSFLASTPPSGSGAAVVAGLAALAATAMLWPRADLVVRVGAMGVSYGEVGDERRVPWCDVERVRLAADQLVLEVNGQPMSIPLSRHAAAAARILAEASMRLGDRVDVSPSDHDRLPELVDDDAPLVPAEVQLAGRRCAASGKPITFEGDAKLCGNCAALYHAARAPERCQSCQRPL